MESPLDVNQSYGDDDAEYIYNKEFIAKSIYYSS
jgi:hypothetical protein